MAKAAAHTAQHAKKHAVSKVPHGNGGAGYSKKDLLKYSLIVIVGLIVVGAAVWAVDTGASYALMKFASLRP